MKAATRAIHSRQVVNPKSGSRRSILHRYQAGLLPRVTITLICLFLLLLPFATVVASAELNGSQRQITVGERELAVWTWLPMQSPERGVILFSHGYASAPWKYEQLIRPWVESGYRVEAPLHVDSTDHPRRDDFPGLAAWTARLEDMRALSQELAGASYVAAGHSFGALTALALGGAEAFVPDEITAPLEDAAVSVVLAFSPPPTVEGLISEEGYSSLSRPALIQTGTLDVPMGADYPWEKHLDAFHMAKSGGHRYALVLAGVDHYFGGGICRPELPGPQQLAELEVASQLSILMIQAYAEHAADALTRLEAYLQGEGPTVLMYK